MKNISAKNKLNYQILQNLYFIHSEKVYTRSVNKVMRLFRDELLFII